MAGGLWPAGADEGNEGGLGVVVSRINGFEQGLLGDVEPVGDGGITKEALHNALRPGSAPRFDTVDRVCTALGVRLVVQPLHSA